MSKFNPWQSGTALFTAIAIASATIAPLAIPTPVFAQRTTFRDVSSDYWARDFITALAARNIITGFPDGRFRPEAPVTRSQFATMIVKAFSNKDAIRQPINFTDVPRRSAAAAAIQQAYRTGFLSGFPNNRFQPNRPITREQVLVSLAAGLDYAASSSTNSVLNYYRDNSDIPEYARDKIAAATEKGIAVNYPDVRQLKPNQFATRAEVAAILYQALVNAGEVQAITSPYIARVDPNNQEEFQALVGRVRIPSGTRLPVKYDTQTPTQQIQPNEPAPIPLRLTLTRNIISENRTLLIPSGSTIEGELVVIEAEKGAQFVARRLILPNGNVFSISATSQMIKRTVVFSGDTTRRSGRIARNAGLGAAAATGLIVLTGGTASLGVVLIGAGAGAGADLFGLFRNRTRREFIAINPNTDLTLTLNADLVLQQ